MFSHHSLPGTPTPPGTTAISLPTWMGFVLSSISPALAVVITNPLDVAKVQMQLQGRNVRYQHESFRHLLRSMAPGSTTHPITRGLYFRSPVHCLQHLYRCEGLRGVQRGLSAAIFREGSKNLLRIGLFDPILDMLHDRSRNGSPPLWKRMVAGALSGKASVLMCQPFEVLKTRLQAGAAPFLLDNHLYHYRSAAHGAATIARTEGIPGFYRASNMSMLRSSVGSSVNLTVYTATHEWLLHNDKMEDGFKADALCSALSAMCTTIVTNPVDVIRTRLLAQPVDSEAWYPSAWRAFRQILAREGVLAFYKGVFANFMFLAPHFVLTFVILEHLRRLSVKWMVDRELVQEATRTFRFFDVHKNGFITREELAMAMQLAYPTERLVDENGKIVSEEEFESYRQARVDQILDTCDHDQNQMITYNEFEIVMAEMRELKLRCEWRKVFNSIDTDRNGVLDRRELLDALHLSPAVIDQYQFVSESELEKMIGEIMAHGDANADDVLSFEEFFDLVKRAHQFSTNHVLRSWYVSAGVALP